MTQKLIALVDGSTYSKSVCDAAAWIARRGDLSVELMHVLGRRDPTGGLICRARSRSAPGVRCCAI